MENTKTNKGLNCMEATVKVSDLNFADWKAIALAVGVGRDEKWAFYRWQENGFIPPMSIEEWEAIADETGFSHGWAYHQYKNQKSLQAQGVE